MKTEQDPTTEKRESVNLYQGILVPTSVRGGQVSETLGALPELNLTVRRRLTHDFILSLGYTLLYLHDAIRVGDHVDTEVNGSRLQDEDLPLARELAGDGGEPSSRPFVEKGLWVQGVRVGLEW